jgi:tRNA(Ile)-lysidine synthase
VDTVNDKVLRFIEKHQLLNRTDPVIVGVSGGPDSVALLHLLVNNGYRCSVAHCNFQLRNEESDRDVSFVRQLALDLSVPFHVKSFSTLTYAQDKHLSIEMAARELRYQWFEKLHAEQNAQAVAVAHHQNDSIETVLINLIRGTGLRGLRGIKPKNGYVVRPLLCLKRDEILDWLAQQKIQYQTDTSNLSEVYDRNFIRLQLLPIMRKLNLNVNASIARAANHLADVELIYDHWIQMEQNNVMDTPDQINITRLLQTVAPQTLLYEVLKPLGFSRPITNNIFDSFCSSEEKIFDAPHANCRVVKNRDVLIITDKNIRDKIVYDIQPDSAIVDPIALSTHLQPIDPEDFKLPNDPNVATLDYQMLHFPLQLRKWKYGDWFVPLGMHGRKKLSDFFTDLKLNTVQKNNIWLLCSQLDIVWIVGHRIDNRYKIKKNTKLALTVQLFNR